MPKKEAKTITFYQSPIGAPFASDGTFIARWGGRWKDKDFYESMKLKKFEKLYPRASLRAVPDMPEDYRKGLTKALARAVRSTKRTPVKPRRQATTRARRKSKNSRPRLGQRTGK